MYATMRGRGKFISKTQRENRPSDHHLSLNNALATGAQLTQHHRQQYAHRAILGPQQLADSIMCPWEDGAEVI